MADSSVPITAGSGTNIDTRTTTIDGDHRQVIVIGDPATDAGVAPVDVTAGLKVDLGADNDITMATLPDTVAGDLAAINSAISGTLTVGSHAVTNAGTFVVQENGAALTALQLIDDVVFVDDTATHTSATTKGMGIMAVAIPTDGSVDANDIAMPAMSLDRRLHTDAQIVGQDGDITIADGGNSITIDGAVTANAGTGDFNVSLQDGSGVDLTSTLVGADQSLDVNLTQSVALDVSAATVTVDLGVNNDVTITGGALTALQLIDNPVATISATDVMRVAIFDASDTQITSFGGGTQYTEGDIDTTITGTAAMMEVGSDTLQPIQGSVAGGLLVNLGANNDVTLNANSGVDIGDVDVTSIIPGTGATNLGKAEDAVHTSGDVGVMALSVRQDVAGTLAGSNGDYQPLLTNGQGALRVNIDSLSGSAVVAGLVASGTITSNAQAVEIFVHGRSTALLEITGIWSGTLKIQGQIDTAWVDIIADDLTAEGKLQIKGNPASGATGRWMVNAAGYKSIRVVSTAWTSGSAAIYWLADTGFSEKHAGVGIAGNTFDSNTLSQAIGGYGDDGTFQPLPIETVAIDTNLLQAGGNIDHDGVDAGKPLKIGGKASSSAPTAVASGDRVNAYFDTNGKLAVFDGGDSITVDNAGTFAVQSSQATASNLNAQVVGNVASAASDSGNPVKVGGIFNTTQPTVTTGQRVNLQATNRGALIVAPGVENFAVQSTLQTGSNVIGALTANQSVNVAQINGVTTTMGNGVSGTGVQRVTIASDSTGQIIALGNIAHDGVDSGNPVKVGLKAISHGTNPTAVAANDRTDWYANLHGVPWVIGGHPNIVTLRANYTAAQTDTAIVSVSAGTKIVVTRCSVTVGNAVSVNVQARVGFGTATTPTTTGVVLSHPNIAPGSGVIEGNGSGILGVGGDDDDLRITSAVPTGGSIDVVVSYYTIAS